MTLTTTCGRRMANTLTLQSIPYFSNLAELNLALVYGLPPTAVLQAALEAVRNCLLLTAYFLLLATYY